MRPHGRGRCCGRWLAHLCGADRPAGLLWLRGPVRNHDVPRMQRISKRFGLAVHKNAPGEAFPERFRQRPRSVHTRLRRDKHHAVACVHHRAQLGFLPVQADDRRRARRTAEKLPLPVQGKRQVRAGTAHQLAVIAAVHQQHVPDGQRPAAEQLGGRAVQGHDIAVVDHAEGCGYRDAQRRGIFRVVERVFVRKRILFKMIARNGNPHIIHPERLGNRCAQAVQLAPAARQEGR